MPEWFWGTAINVVGSVVINLGTNLIKLSHLHREQSIVCNLRTTPFYQSPTWLLGVMLFAFGNVANFISFGFAAQSMLSALGSVQFVSNVIFSSQICDEAITPRILISTLWIVIGNCCIVLFADPKTNDFSAEDLWNLYIRQDYIIYMLALFIVAVSSHIVYRHIDQNACSAREEGFAPEPIESLLPIIYALVSAIIGTQSVMLAKSISILLKTSIVDSNQMADPGLYLVVILWLSTMSFW